MQSLPISAAGGNPRGPAAGAPRAEPVVIIDGSTFAEPADPGPAEVPDRFGMTESAYCRQMRAAASPAGRAIHRAYWHLRDAEDGIREWLASHGAGCDCEFCGYRRTRGADAERDLTGLAWTLELLICGIEEHAFGLPRDFYPDAAEGGKAVES